jgi:enoyl-CoA hydratase/carnithine racemase
MTITLNRPEAMNAITSEMLSDLNLALKAADDDRDVRAVILTGSGRAFCSGLDLKQAAQGGGIAGALSGAGGANHYSTREICTVTLQRMDTPVIAAHFRPRKTITRLCQNGGYPRKWRDLVFTKVAWMGKGLRNLNARRSY